MTEIEYKASLFEEYSEMMHGRGLNLEMFLKEWVRIRDVYIDKMKYYEIIVATNEKDVLEDKARYIGTIEGYNRANEIIVNNVCDIWEYTYDYAGIVAKAYGLYSYPIFKEVYKFNHDTEMYELIAEYDETCFKVK